MISALERISASVADTCRISFPGKASSGIVSEYKVYKDFEQHREHKTLSVNVTAREKNNFTLVTGNMGNDRI